MRRKLDKILFILGVILIIGGFIIGKVSEFLAPQVTSVLGAKNYQAAEVIQVVDGDTIRVLLDGKDETIRFIGIDTPETVDPRKPVQCFGKQASDFIKAKLTGKQVFLQNDITQTDRDKYQRLLRYVFLPDGTNVNLLLIQQGYAHEYTYDVPYQYQAEFKASQQDAVAHNRGLWGSCKQ